MEELCERLATVPVSDKFPNEMTNVELAAALHPLWEARCGSRMGDLLAEALARLARRS